MKKITMFHLARCKYCMQAKKAIDELTAENSKYGTVELELIDESRQPEIADKYDYYCVPSMFIGSEKLYEARPGEGYDECKANVKRVFDAALAE